MPPTQPMMMGARAGNAGEEKSMAYKCGCICFWMTFALAMTAVGIVVGTLAMMQFYGDAWTYEPF